MTRLNCSVDNCGHYCEGYCCAGNIAVDGRKAQAVKDTCCSSYIPKQGMTNSATNPTAEIEIGCDAKNCVHNCSGSCSAEHVSIGNPGACCCEETQCDSFCDK